MRLVTAWLEHRATLDGSAAASARYLNARLARQYTPSRISEWKHGKRPIPDEVVALMRDEVLPSLLDEAGFDDPQERDRVMDILKVLL